MKAIAGFFFGGAKIQPGWAELGLLIARLGLGGMMALAHGWGKLPVQQGFIDGVAAMGFPYPALFAWAAALSEFAGGALIVVGLFTRPAALMLAATMVVAAFIKHGADPLQNKELALVYLGFALIMLFLGAGRFSIDVLIRKRG